MKSLLAICSLLASIGVADAAASRPAGAARNTQPNRKARLNSALLEVLPGLQSAHTAAVEWRGTAYASKPKLDSLKNVETYLGVEKWLGRDQDGLKAYYYIMETAKIACLYESDKIVSCGYLDPLGDAQVRKLSSLRYNICTRAAPGHSGSMPNSDIAGRVWEWALAASLNEGEDVYVLATFMMLVFRNLHGPPMFANTNMKDTWIYKNNKPGYFGVTGIPYAYCDYLGDSFSKRLFESCQGLDLEQLQQMVVDNYYNRATIYAEFLFFKKVYYTIRRWFDFQYHLNDTLFPLIAFYDERMLGLAKCRRPTDSNDPTVLLLHSYAHVHLKAAYLIFDNVRVSKCALQ